ncbi:FAST kinase domain-containing protein 4 [Synchiropus splendidus]|uniref:FAST kinase domain-containing protein 4 n=1 Tax=Synchiropus splendidus TaxID=270530 RepID=UPI00237E81DC|nr:FAST kinase domain-containing protein 4 [Synchiropus splendidus]XP_053743610.1 FAST kinase domain-containing protein 4 [Synchiropus splendidus]XP_053743611.1 FAST kinase domain-containing protein 4 [Synchiropus splendidus]
MACRLLARCGRLLCRSSAHAPASRFHSPGSVLTELLPSSSRRAVSARFMSDPSATASEDRYDAFLPFTPLDKKVDVMTIPEDILLAWVEHEGNGNQGANAFIKWTKLVLKARESGKEQPDAMTDPRLKDIMNVVSKQISTVWNNNLVFLLQSLWTLNSPHTTTFLSSVQNEVLWRIRRLSYKQLGLLVNVGLHRKGQQDAAIVNSALKQLELRWTEISDAKTVSALMSKGKYLSPTLMDRLEDKALELAEGFSGEEIRRVCASLAALGRRSVPLLRALSYHLVQRPTSEFTIPLIMDVAYAYAKLNFHQSQMLQRLASELLLRISELTPADVTRFSKSLGFLKWQHVPLFEAFAEHFIENSDKYSSPQFCNLIMAFARLGFQPSKGEEFYSKVHAVLEGSLSGLEPSLQTDVVWSLCVLQQARPSYLLPLTQQKHISALSDGRPAPVEGHRLKLLHIAATLDLEHPDPTRSCPLPSLAALCIPAGASTVTPMQSSLRTALQSLVGERPEALRTGVETVHGWTIDGEVVVDCESKPVDLTEMKAPHLPAGGGDQGLPDGARRLAFVAWDFSSFSSKSKELLGRFVMMKRHLQLAGFLIVEVPYYEWLELKTDWKKISYLKDKMGKVVAEDMAK